MGHFILKKVLLQDLLGHFKGYLPLKIIFVLQRLQNDIENTF